MIQKFLQRVAEYLYDYLKSGKFSYVCFPKSVQKDIQALYKDEKVYYVQKLTYVVALFGVGILLAVGYWGYICFVDNSVIDHIERPEAYEEKEEIALKVGSQDDIFYLEVTPVLLSKEEADAQVKELLKELEFYILGANESLEAIVGNLNLPEAISGYPFEIYWESDNEQLIDSMGNVNRAGLAEDSIVVLTAIFYYEDWMWEEQFGVLVQKEVLTDAERYERELGQLLEDAEATQRSSEILELPEKFADEVLSYHEVKEDYTILLVAGVVLVAGIGIWIGQDQDLHGIRSKRQKAYQSEYISFAGSLSLYISAGMNLQTALMFCVQDYSKRKEEGHLLRNTLLEFQKDIHNGYGFLEALERFVDSTDDINYRRLAGLLSQGMLNGSQGLAELLEKEVDKTREEKRRHSKVLGEQISTALIAPMMLQLGIVIALIMIPAFTSMQF